MSKSQKYMGRYIGYKMQQSAYRTTNGAFYLAAPSSWYVDGNSFDTLNDAKSYIENLKTTGEEF